MAKRIMLCDDDEVYGPQLAEFLKGAGYTVYRCVDTAQLSVFLDKELPDLILLDMQMPGGGGPGALERLAKTPDSAAIPVIISSGMPVEHQKKWVGDKKNVRFLQKPIDLDNLQSLIDSLLLGPKA